MAGPLRGLTGLYGPVDNTPHGTTVRDPGNWGGAADARHHIPGDSSHMVPRYTATPYPQDPSVPGQIPGLSVVPGEVRDDTPRTHAAPYPRGAQTDLVEAAEQTTSLHGRDLGGARYLNDGPVPYPFSVEVSYDLSPNQSGLAPVPGQLRSLSTDTDQGYGHDNSGTFGYGHQQRRTFHDPVPTDYTTLDAGERPWYGKHAVWQNRLDGHDSPYAQAGDISVDMSLGVPPVGFPTPYQAPPDPTVAPYTTYSTEAPSIGGDWMAG